MFIDVMLTVLLTFSFTNCTILESVLLLKERRERSPCFAASHQVEKGPRPDVTASHLSKPQVYWCAQRKDGARGSSKGQQRVYVYIYIYICTYLHNSYLSNSVCEYGAHQNVYESMFHDSDKASLHCARWLMMSLRNWASKDLSVFSREGPYADWDTAVAGWSHPPRSSMYAEPTWNLSCRAKCVYVVSHHGPKKKVLQQLTLHSSWHIQGMECVPACSSISWISRSGWHAFPGVRPHRTAASWKKFGGSF